MTEQANVEQNGEAKVLDDDAAFESGFNNDAGDASPAAAQPDGEAAQETQEGAQAGAAAEPAAPAKDPWEGVAPVLRASIEGITKKLGELDLITQQVRSTNGRVGSIEQRLQTALAAGQSAANKAGADTPTQQQLAAAAVSGERWKKLELDYPEFAAAFQEQLAAREQNILGRFPKFDADGLKKDVVGSVTPLIDAAKRETREFSRVDARHDGWEDLVRSKEFGTWLDKQGTDTKALAESDRAADAIKLIDAYKASIKTPAPAQDPAKKQQQQNRLEAATTPSGAAQRPAASLTDDDAFVAGFNQA